MGRSTRLLKNQEGIKVYCRICSKIQHQEERTPEWIEKRKNTTTENTTKMLNHLEKKHDINSS